MLTRCILAVLFLTSVATHAQTPATPGYTLKASGRVVLTDVTVTDGKDQPVHGLKASDFHLSDNKVPQTIASFEENQPDTPSPALLPTAATPGTYSNDYLLHLPRVLNVVVIDITNLQVPDQMYLAYQFEKLLKALPEGQMLAIYFRGGPTSVLLQGFTANHALLTAAVRKAVPRFPIPGHEYASELQTLQQVARDLAQIPGRKNVLWFSGGANFLLHPDGAMSGYNFDMRPVYDQLESERIAVYPIDARGLTVYAGGGQIEQHFLMSEVADATGGKAYFDTNGLWQSAIAVTRPDSSFYTITYSPKDLHLDNKWHKVSVTVDGNPYHLSYRQGYFADGNNQPVSQPEKARTRLLANGTTLDVPDFRSAPIIFQAQVLPTSQLSILSNLPPGQKSPKKGTTPFTIRYTLQSDSFTRQTIDGKQHLVLGMAAIAFNQDGYAVAHSAEQVKGTLDGDLLQRAPQTPFHIDQQINLAKGDLFLYLTVWDTTSHRVGTLQVPLKVPAAAKAAH